MSTRIPSDLENCIQAPGEHSTVIPGGDLAPPWDTDAATHAGTETKVRRRKRAYSGSVTARRSQRFAHWLATASPGGVGAGELQAHFRCMPARYWDRLTNEELHWHLKTIHAFFAKQAGTNTEEIPIAVDWRHSPEEGCTRFVFCTWDQRRLLERITAAFNALRVSILAADVYTRTDNLVLDVFEAAEPGGGPLRDADRLNSLPFLVEGALSDPPRFAAVWATEFHKFAPRPPESEVRLGFDNRRSGDTLLRVEAPDRLGLLYDLLHVMSEHDLRVSQAIIETNEGLARDVFHFTDAGGSKVINEAQLARLKVALIAALTT